MELLLFIIGVLAILAFRRAGRAERTLVQQRIELSQLRTMVQSLQDQLNRTRAAASPQDAAAVNVASDAGFAPAGAMTLPGDTAGVSGAAPATASSEPAVFVAPPDTAAAASDASRPDLGSAPEPALPASGFAPTTAGQEPATAPFVPAHVAAAPPRESIETRIGGRWLLYIGVAALVIGVSYFVKYAFDNEWINQPTRVFLGLLGGAALTVIGQRFVQSGYKLYGQALSGGGIGIIYLAIFAAHRWYELIGRPIAFVGMILTTAFAAWLADRQRSQPLALMAVTVGFGTPFLIGGDGDAQISLFTYDAILVAGTLYLARRRSWPALDLVSYVLTLLTIGSWAEVYYTPGAYLVTQLFLTLFLVLFLFVLREHWAAAATNPLAALVQVTLSLAPLLYHIASLTILFPHQGALLVYLIAFTLAGLIVARQLHVPWLRILIWLAAALPFYVFIEQRVGSRWLIATWITLIAIYGLHLFAQVHRLDDERPHAPEPSSPTPAPAPAPAAAPAPVPAPVRLPGGEIFLLHANGLWLLFCVEGLIAPRRTGEWAAGAAFALAVWYGALAGAAWRWHRDAALHAIAWASALVAIGCAIQFNGPWFIVSLATEGAVLVWLALSTQRPWVQAWGGALLALATLRAIGLLTEPAPVSYWTLFNPRALACLFVVCLLYGLAWLQARHESTPGASALARATLILGANVLTVAVMSTEIDAFYERRAWQTGATTGVGGETTADVARQLTFSVAWALYAMMLVAVGIRRNYRPIRYFAILLFAITIGKVFLVDLSTLDRVYKMLSVMALGVILLIASYLYQRLRSEAPGGPNAIG